MLAALALVSPCRRVLAILGSKDVGLKDVGVVVGVVVVGVVVGVVVVGVVVVGVVVVGVVVVGVVVGVVVVGVVVVGTTVPAVLTLKFYSVTSRTHKRKLTPYFDRSRQKKMLYGFNFLKNKILNEK